MSYILNALRKSERERQSFEPDTITDRIVIDHSPRSISTATVIAALIVINVAILVYFLGFTEKKTIADSEMVTQTMTESVPIDNNVSSKASIIKKTPDQQIRETDSGILNATPEVAHKKQAVALVKPTAVNRPTEVKKPNHAIIPVAAPVVPVEPTQAAMTKVNPTDKSVIGKPSVPLLPTATLAKSDRENLPRPENQVEEVPPKQNDIRANEVSETTDVETKSSSSQNRLPFLDELPYEFQRQLPELPINVFSYSAAADERFVMIDMVKYVPGQRIKDLLDLREIRSDGIVVDYKGRTFILRRH